MTGLNYPDNLYADHEEAKARRVANQAPTGAYRAAPEMPEAERKLRTARHYLHHALLLVDEALGNAPAPEPGSLDALRIERNGPPERVPKWDPAWGKPHTQRNGYSEGSCSGVFGPIPQNRPPNCDGLSARDIRSQHPMSAEVIRDRDERLSGAEDRL